MSGKQAKRARRTYEVSIAARRDQQAFTRAVARAIVARSEVRFRRRRAVRQLAAWWGLAVVAGLVVWGLFG
jgi:hypothetical protein